VRSFIEPDQTTMHRSTIPLRFI